MNFQGSGDELPPPEDAEFVFELWDWDKFTEGMKAIKFLRFAKNSDKIVCCSGR